MGDESNKNNGVQSAGFGFCFEFGQKKTKL